MASTVHSLALIPVQMAVEIDGMPLPQQRPNAPLVVRMQPVEGVMPKHNKHRATCNLVERVFEKRKPRRQILFVLIALAEP